MHCVTDRNNYVQIKKENIKDYDDTWGNFDIIFSASLSDEYFPYDYESIMHYSEYAYSKNDFPTIVVIRSVS